MFGAVTAINVHEKLVEAGFEALTRKQVHLSAPIKELGQHTVTVKVYQDVTAELKFDVVSENPIVEEETEDAEEEEAPASE
jgi:large subunit ribosomal protein L9